MNIRNLLIRIVSDEMYMQMVYIKYVKDLLI